MASSGPNILFILADDLGYADVSCYGRRDFTTPNIDRIAAEGVRFTQAYANSAVCTASRVALITGRYQYRLAGRARRAAEHARAAQDRAAAGAPDLAVAPEEGRLPTALIGKWHLGVLPDFGPLQSGYDHFYGFRSGAVDYFTHKSGPPASDTDDLWDDDAQDPADRLSDRSAGRPRRRGDRTPMPEAGQPFLISLHFNAPHWPWEAPGDEAESQRLCRSLFHYDGGTQRTYQRMIQQMDLQIGRVLQALDANGAGREHDRHLHQRQRRRALFRHLAVHRQKDRTAGGRFAHSGGDPLAGPHSARHVLRAGDDRHGLVSDLARRRRHRSRPGLSARRHRICCRWLTEAAAPASTQAVLALQRQRPAGGARRRLEVSQDPRQHLPVRCVRRTRWSEPT